MSFWSKVGHALSSARNAVVHVATATALDPVAIPIVEAYRANLRSQAHWNRLPAELIQALHPHYPGAELTKVRYAMNVNTRHGKAITFENEIFFPRTLSLRSRDDLWWMLHELAHVQQYARLGGRFAFYHAYIKDMISSIVSQRSLDLGSIQSIEQQASRRADEIVDRVHGKW